MKYVVFAPWILLICFAGMACNKGNTPEPPQSIADSLSQPIVFGGYFPWHGTPAIDGQWSRWNDEGRKPDQQDINSMFWPEKGLYSSGDSTVLRLQAREMIQAGIDVVIIFWNNAYEGEQDRVERAMKVFGQEGLQGIVAVDFNWNMAGSTLQDMALRLETVVNTYAKESISTYHNFYYRDPVSGYPVFMVYGPFRFGTPEFWNDHIRQYKDQPAGGIFIAGKESDMETISASLFDGMSWTGHAARTDDREGHEFHLNSLKRNMFYVGGVIAGFDESHRPQQEVIVLPREEGRTFGTKWGHVIESAASDGRQVAHVYVPFNDWGEGIGIEPVADSGPNRMPDYNDPFARVPAVYQTNSPLSPSAYLDLNRQFANEFKQSRK